MNYRVLGDFNRVRVIPQDEIAINKNKLPEELLNIWSDLGLGTFMSGYMKIIDPKVYQDILQDSYFRGDVSIPIIITGLGDILTWEKNEYIGMVKFRKTQFEIISHGFEYFFDDLTDDFYMGKYFNVPQYEEALAKYGALKFDECFGYVPLLGLGGPEDVNHLDKVKIIEHIALITQLLGKIE